MESIYLKDEGDLAQRECGSNSPHGEGEKKDRTERRV